MKKEATLFTDGGARGNPGPAAIGVVLTRMDAPSHPYEIGETIGETTNNVAEYKALLRGLREAFQQGITHLSCSLDSELVVKQVTGVYRTKDVHLLELRNMVQQEIRQFAEVTFRAIPRAQNKRADQLVNFALDKAAPPSP